MSAVKYPAGYFDSNEQLVFYAVCGGRGCDWEDDETYSGEGEHPHRVCPECGCDDLNEESVWL